MTTTDRKKKKKKLRHLEYYNMQNELDKLYELSSQGYVFNDLMQLILSDRNILLAYRNIKRNSGSNTSGVDKETIKHLENKTPEELIQLVRNRLSDYKPKPVKRVWIDKPGKTEKRPLGIPTIQDRLCQQCILQILEPIVETKFYKHSYGFRPNRSTKHAIKRFTYLIFNAKLHYVVDIDVKGFFDNVNHNKLLKQIWTMGINDKHLLSIINKMLKAEIEGEGIPIKGVPQGGILSPILSNIVLNELDAWICSQWEDFKTHSKYKRKGSMHSALKFTNLKEMWIVRYCDDFKILCRNHKDAEKIFIAVKKWLKERLGLEVNANKSGIINLRRRNTEFLGIKIKVIKKSKRYTIRSDITDKAKQNINQKLQQSIINIKKHPKKNEVNLINSKILGLQNYYNMATLVNLSFNKIAYRINRCINHTLKGIVTTRGSPTKLYKELYGKYSYKIIYIAEIPIFQIGAVKFLPPPVFNPKICNYSTDGRELIHDNLTCINTEFIQHLIEHPDNSRSIEYNDNSVSVYTSQYGKCAITGKVLEIGNCILYNKNPLNKGGNDRFKNLIFIVRDIYDIITEADITTRQQTINKLNLDPKQLAKVVKLLEIAEN